MGWGRRAGGERREVEGGGRGRAGVEGKVMFIRELLQGSKSRHDTYGAPETKLGVLGCSHPLEKRRSQWHVRLYEFEKKHEGKLRGPPGIANTTAIW